MPPKKVPPLTSTPTSSSQHEALGDFTKLKDAWKKDFKLMSAQLKEDIDSMISIKNCVSKEENQDINNLVKCELEKFEANWNMKLENLEVKLKETEKHLNSMFDKIDCMEQYTKKQSLIIYGVPETESENIITVTTDLLNEKFNMALIQTDFNNVYRIGKVRELKRNSNIVNGDVKTKPIFVDFVRDVNRNKIFMRKKLLKDSGITVVENLTKERNDLYRQMRSLNLNCWTNQGNILVNIDNKRIKLVTLSSIKALIADINAEKAKN